MAVNIPVQSTPLLAPPTQIAENNVLMPHVQTGENNMPMPHS